MRVRFGVQAGLKVGPPPDSGLKLAIVAAALYGTTGVQVGFTAAAVAWTK